MTVGDPRDEFAAGRLRVDPQFGKQLETLLVPGTTVLITDQSIGGAPDPTSSGYASVTVPLHGELSAGVDAAP